MGVKINEVVELNGKKYICFKIAYYLDTKFVYFISDTKPVEIKFAKEIIDGEELKMEIINNPDEKEFALSLFDNKKEDK